MDIDGIRGGCGSELTATEVAQLKSLWMQDQALLASSKDPGNSTLS
jgi:hypothetical protein